MSHQVGVSGVYKVDNRFKLSTSAGFEAAQQKSQATPRLSATSLGPVDLCGQLGSQGVLRVRPEKFIKLKQTKSLTTWRKGSIGRVVLV